MTKYTQLTERHIVEYESKLKHIDELLKRAHETVPQEKTALASELSELTSKRETLAGHLEEMRQKSQEDRQEKAIEQAGPMGIWDAVAQQIESLIERF